MNLELLGDSKSKLPDRVDATLSLQEALHFTKGVSDKGSREPDNKSWKSANAVAFNRRVTYVAVGYSSGTVAVYDVLSRTIGGLYRHGEIEDVAAYTIKQTEEAKLSRAPHHLPNSAHGVTSLSWSRRSRSLLVGAAGDATVRLIDTTHPSGPDECSLGYKKDEKEKSENREDDDLQSSAAEAAEKKKKSQSWFRKEEHSIVHHRKSRHLEIIELISTKEANSKPEKRKTYQSHFPTKDSKRKRYPSLTFKLPLPIGTTLQIHPKDTCSGLAAISDGSLVAFLVPLSAWEDQGSNEGPQVKIATIHKSDDDFITAAVFDSTGDRVYAATANGKLLGFDVISFFNIMSSNAGDIPRLRPGFMVHIPGGSTAWHLKINRAGTAILVNSSDSVIRLYSTKECWTNKEEVDKPTMVFHEASSPTPFTSCDFSGDGDYVLGASNGNGSDGKYELHVWNASTGELMDMLTGAPTEILDAAWHPTRSFLAVASSDGLVDIWGPRINWTAFAPDFQALTQNIEYVECEDELDLTPSESGKGSNKHQDEDESEDVDILTVSAIPAFASDSEDEEDVFRFETRVTRNFGLVNN